VRFFSQVQRIGAGNPVFGPFPVGFESLEGSPHALVGDRGRNDALLEADLGGQFQGPGAALFAKIAGTAMQQVFEPLEPFLRKAGVQAMGARRAFLQHGQTGGIEAMDDIANRLVVAAELLGNGDSPFSPGAGEQDLAAAQDKGIRRTQSGLDLLPFVLGQRADKNGCFHALYCTTFPIISGGNALAESPCRCVTPRCTMLDVEG
jgi:hypothetical protein